MIIERGLHTSITFLNMHINFEQFSWCAPMPISQQLQNCCGQDCSKHLGWKLHEIS